MSPNFIGNLHRFGPRGLWNVQKVQKHGMVCIKSDYDTFLFQQKSQKILFL